MSLGVVIIVLRHLRQPETAERVGRVFSDHAGPMATAGEQDRNDAASSSNPRRQTADSIVIATNSDDSKPSGDSPTLDDLRRQALDVVRDNMYFRKVESPAWFGLIARLQESTPEELSSSS